MNFQTVGETVVAYRIRINLQIVYQVTLPSMLQLAYSKIQYDGPFNSRFRG